MSTYEQARYNFTGTNLVALNGSAITNGTVVAARIADLAASKITTGTFNDARLAASNITQHVDLSNLSASNLTSGTIPNARYGTPTFDGTNVTNTGATVTSGTWTASLSSAGGHTTLRNITSYYLKIGQIVYATWEGEHTFSMYNYGFWIYSFANGNNTQGNNHVTMPLPYTAINTGDNRMNACITGSYNGRGASSTYTGDMRILPSGTSAFSTDIAGFSANNLSGRYRLKNTSQSLHQFETTSDERFIKFAIAYYSAS
tara:strand:- start:5 stop:781 length:777 start_codon:yes stop_codon:yes gene_type:complete